MKVIVVWFTIKNILQNPTSFYWVQKPSIHLQKRIFNACHLDCIFSSLKLIKYYVDDFSFFDCHKLSFLNEMFHKDVLWSLETIFSQLLKSSSNVFHFYETHQPSFCLPIANEYDIWEWKRCYLSPKLLNNCLLPFSSLPRPKALLANSAQQNFILILYLFIHPLRFQKIIQRIWFGL